MIIIQRRNKRLFIKTLARCLIQCIGKCSKNRGKCRFAHARWIKIILHKMNVNGFWRLTMTDHAVGVKIVFSGTPSLNVMDPYNALPIPSTIATFCKVDSCIGIYHNAAINGTAYSWYYQLAIFKFHIQHLCNIGIVTEVSGNTPVIHLVGIFPSRIFREQVSTLPA